MAAHFYTEVKYQMDNTVGVFLPSSGMTNGVTGADAHKPHPEPRLLFLIDLLVQHTVLEQTTVATDDLDSRLQWTCTKLRNCALSRPVVQTTYYVQAQHNY